MKNLFLTILSFILLIGLITCKEEPSENPLSEAEITYLRDYVSPDFLWGYVDKNGDVAIEPIYDDVRDFNEGLAATNYQGFWGFIDHNGEFLIDPKYRAVYNFSEGFAVVKTFSDTFKIVNKKAQIVLDLPYMEVSPISSGKIKVRGIHGYFYLDLQGNPINQEFYDKAFNFEKGLAIVGLNGLTGIIDTSGNDVLPLKFPDVAFLNEEFSKVKLENNNYRLYDLKERQFIQDHYKSIISSGNTGIAVLDFNDNWTLFFPENNKFIKVTYDQLYPGGQGKWIVRATEKFGIIDADGHQIATPKYDALYQFSEDRCVYKLGDFWGYLDENGKEILPPIFPLAWDFENGLARVILEGGIGFINKNGELAIPAKFVEVRDFYEEYARFQNIR